MPTRSLPRNDDERTTAMHGCLGKYANSTATAQLISGEQFTTLQATSTEWDTTKGALGPLLRAQSHATDDANVASTVLTKNISHFIQVFNLAVDRGIFSAADRAYYQLPVSSATVPALDNLASLELWAGRLIKGDADRVTAGGEPMAMPGIPDVVSALRLFTLAGDEQSTAKTAYDAAQGAVAALRPTVDLRVKDIWDTIEFKLRALDAPGLRRAAQEWGVVYAADSTPPVPPAPTPPLTPPVTPPHP